MYKSRFSREIEPTGNIYIYVYIYDICMYVKIYYKPLAHVITEPDESQDL